MERRNRGRGERLSNPWMKLLLYSEWRSPWSLWLEVVFGLNVLGKCVMTGNLNWSVFCGAIIMEMSCRNHWIKRQAAWFSATQQNRYTKSQTVSPRIWNRLAIVMSGDVNTRTIELAFLRLVKERKDSEQLLVDLIHGIWGNCLEEKKKKKWFLLLSFAL